MYNYFHLASSGYLIVIYACYQLVTNTVPSQTWRDLFSIMAEESTRSSEGRGWVFLVASVVGGALKRNSSRPE